MKFGIYAIRDAFTGFLTPTFDLNDQVAKRNFAYAIKQKNSLLYSNAQDYDLYKIGEFDQDSGVISPLDHHQLICTGLSVKESVDHV